MLWKVDHVHERGSWNMKNNNSLISHEGTPGETFFSVNHEEGSKKWKQFIYKCQLVLKMTLEKEHFGINFAKNW